MYSHLAECYDKIMQCCLEDVSSVHKAINKSPKLWSSNWGLKDKEDAQKTAHRVVEKQIPYFLI